MAGRGDVGGQERGPPSALRVGGPGNPAHGHSRGHPSLLCQAKTGSRRLARNCEFLPSERASLLWVSALGAPDRKWSRERPPTDRKHLADSLKLAGLRGGDSWFAARRRPPNLLHSEAVTRKPMRRPPLQLCSSLPTTAPPAAAFSSSSSPMESRHREVPRRQPEPTAKQRFARR